MLPPHAPSSRDVSTCSENAADDRLGDGTQQRTGPAGARRVIKVRAVEDTVSDPLSSYEAISRTNSLGTSPKDNIHGVVAIHTIDL
eukprot:scaffold227429_cov37-Prasinocladus_malaysianus.AAC.1